MPITCHISGLVAARETYRSQLFRSTTSPLFCHSGWPQTIRPSRLCILSCL